MDRFGKTVILIFSCWLCSTLLFAENSTYGVLFKSSAELIDHRTSLSLFRDKPLKVNDAFSLSFDLSIWDIKQFGYIVRIINEDKQEISLVFVNFRGENDLYLDLNSSITNKSIQIPVDKKDLAEKTWLRVRLDFDLDKDKVRFSFNDNNDTYDCESVGLRKTDKLTIVFGLHGLNLDVPRMAIRNIRIEEKRDLKYIFPLNESEGEVVWDTKGRALGFVKNPNWIINHHFNWEKEVVFRSECTAGVAYDEKSNKILVINKDSISTYNPQSNIKEDIHIPHIPFTIISGEALYNPRKNACYVYDIKQDDMRSASFAILNMDNYSLQTGRGQLANLLHHHNAFFGNGSDTLYIFGGYGNFCYSNGIYRYNQETSNWDTVTVSGEKIEPRFFAATGEGTVPSEMLIFGGFGNESGRQEHGGKNFYDLFTLDMQHMSLRKNWELKDVHELFVPCNNLIVNEDKTHFYTLCYPHHLAKTALQLYKFNLSDGSYEVVSNSIPILSEKINTRAYLFYNHAIKEFYAIIREYIDEENSEIRIYSLSSPPVTIAALKIYHEKSSQYQFFLLLVGCLIAGMSIILLFIRRKRKQKAPAENIPEKKFIDSEVYIKKNAIYTLGDFLVFDHNGTDITYRFSSKLRSLFALILFNSKGDEMGISTEKLTVDLWPDREVVEAKNIRGVTINHLRNILTDIHGIELIHKNSRWFFAFDDPFYCDYTRSTQLMNNILSNQNKPSGDIDDLLLILKRGNIFPGIQAGWIDPYKRDYESLMENNLLININRFYENGDYRKVIMLSETFFAIDPIDEEVLSLYIKSLKKLGKIKQSRNVYENFCMQYKLSMGEDYSNSYTDVSM